MSEEAKDGQLRGFADWLRQRRLVADHRIPYFVRGVEPRSLRHIELGQRRLTDEPILSYRTIMNRRISDRPADLRLAK